MTQDSDLTKLTANLVTSYIAGWSPSQGDLDEAIEKLPILIQRVYQALDAAGGGSRPAEAAQGTPDQAAPGEVPQPPGDDAPAADPAASINPDYLVCLEDGQRVKLLSRYIKSRYGLTPAEYRAKWGLPPDYPMVAPSYAALRSEVAMRIGLGAGGRGSKPGKLAAGSAVQPRKRGKAKRPVS